MRLLGALTLSLAMACSALASPPKKPKVVTRSEAETVAMRCERLSHALIRTQKALELWQQAGCMGPVPQPNPVKRKK